MVTRCTSDEFLKLIRQYYKDFENKKVTRVWTGVQWIGKKYYNVNFEIEYSEKMLNTEKMVTEALSDEKIFEIISRILKNDNYQLKKLECDCHTDLECDHHFDGVYLSIVPIVKQKVKVRKVSRNDIYGKRKYS